MHGVIAIDLYTVEELLRILGPISPVGYNEEINADNFFERAEFYSEVGFTPGSTGKKDFLGACAAELLTKIRTLDISGLSSVLRVFATSAIEKHLLFAFETPLLSELLTKNNLTGSIRSFEGDYLMVVDSNLGANKANYYIERSLTYDVQIDRDGPIKASLDLNYLHKGKTETWPGGKYKNYLRVYVPEGSVLVETEGFSSEVKTTHDLGKTVFEGLVEVAVDSTQSISLVYNLPETLSVSDSRLQYDLYVQKQAGIVADPLQVRVSWPQYLAVSEVNKGIIKDNLWNLQTDLRLDQEIQLIFSK